MLLLRSLGKLLSVLALGLALYDVCYHWFIQNRFHIRSLKEFWKDVDKKSYESLLPELRHLFSGWDRMASWPLPLILLSVAALLYVLFRLMFAIRGGRGGAYKYNSPD
jgi:hypothetical protein